MVTSAPDAAPQQTPRATPAFLKPAASIGGHDQLPVFGFAAGPTRNAGRNHLLRQLIEFGAADFSGTGTALGAITQIGPVVTVLVVAGAGATAMCADLGARTIREELDALQVLGINPVQALVVPRVLAATLVALLLNSIVSVIGLAGGFFFSVFVQHVTPGAFAAGMTILTGPVEVIVALCKAALFGLAASLIACYKGISVGGGPAGVGNAVNETSISATSGGDGVTGSSRPSRNATTASSAAARTSACSSAVSSAESLSSSGRPLLGR